MIVIDTVNSMHLTTYHQMCDVCVNRGIGEPSRLLGDRVDLHRQYLVHFIADSSAGFIVHGVTLSQAVTWLNTQASLWCSTVASLESLGLNPNCTVVSMGCCKDSHYTQVGEQKD